MIPLVSNCKPLLAVVASNVIHRGLPLLLQYLESITNSDSFFKMSTALDLQYQPPEHQSYFSPTISDEAWTASIWECLFVFYSIYQFCSNAQPASRDVDELGWVEKMPEHIHNKIRKLNELSALNSQLSIFYVFSGLQPSNDEKIVGKQLDEIMNRMNDELLKFFDSHPMPDNELFFNNAFQLFETQPERMTSCNAAFIQLIALANKSKDGCLRNRAHRLYERYLNESEVKRYTRVFRFGDSHNHAVNWNDEHAINYILLADNDLKIVTLLSQHTLDRILQGDHEKIEKGNLNLYNAKGRRLKIHDRPLLEYYQKYYPLFMECVNRRKREETFSDLLKIIIPQDEGMQELFFSSRKNSQSEIKLTGEENESRLEKIFLPWLSYSREFNKVCLDETHCSDILNLYGLSDKSDNEKAKLLLSLSTFFIKCTSAEIFATERESPELIGLYAEALMEKAHELDDKIFGESISSWKEILFSNGIIPANISIQLRRIIEFHKLYFPERLATIMPDAWY